MQNQAHDSSPHPDTQETNVFHHSQNFFFLVKKSLFFFCHTGNTAIAVFETDRIEVLKFHMSECDSNLKDKHAWDRRCRWDSGTEGPYTCRAVYNKRRQHGPTTVPSTETNAYAKLSINNMCRPQCTSNDSEYSVDIGRRPTHVHYNCASQTAFAWFKIQSFASYHAIVITVTIHSCHVSRSCWSSWLSSHLAIQMSLFWIPLRFTAMWSGRIEELPSGQALPFLKWINEWMNKISLCWSTSVMSPTMAMPTHTASPQFHIGPLVAACCRR